MPRLRFRPCGNFKERYEEDITIFETDFGRVWLWVGLALLLLVVPFIAGPYTLYIINNIGIAAIAAIGLNILIGYTGQISLGHGAFFGVGAYAAAILATKVGSPFGVSVLAAGVVTAMVGMIFGLPSVRLKHLYLCIATLAGQFIIEYVLVNWESLTGGTIGIMSVPPLKIGGISFDSELKMYYLVAASVIVAMALAANIINSRVGRAMRAVHGSEIAAEMSGVDTARYKLQVFVLSAAMAGYAGSLYAHHTTYVHPDSFGFHYSIYLVVMVVIGGMASIGGAIFGAGAVTLIAEHLRSFEEFSTVAFGFILVAIMVFLPAGLWRGTAEALRRLRRTAPTPGEEA